MKQILVEKVREESKFFCDKHPERECFSRIQTMSWYGSSHDLNCLDANLCDECLEKFYVFMKTNFNVEPTLNESMLTRRCSCCCKN